MRINRYKRPETGFLSIDRDLETIYSEMAKNENLKKLLFYTHNNPLESPNIDSEGSWAVAMYNECLDSNDTNKRGYKREWFYPISEEEYAQKKKEGWKEMSRTASLFARQIKPIPRIAIDRECLNYILVTFPQIVENKNNPEFRDKIIAFDVVCHFDQWTCQNFAMRPYRIAAELDSIFNDKRMSGIGKLHFLTCRTFALNSEFGGVTLLYAAINGEDDKVQKPIEVANDKYDNYFVESEV